MEPGLYLVGTPIGNLQDITLRALETLRGAALILAEDTRVSRVLLDRHGIAGRLLSYHKFNEAARADEIVSRIRAGEAVALVTDSGMPAVSDPGARLVAACRAAGLPVTVLPGPSAVTAALALAGWESTGFVFGGFLPHKPGPRRRQLAALDQPGLPVVLFESPYRLLKLMDEVEQVLPGREVCVGRELTKKFEETLRGPPAAIRDAFAKREVKGELVVVIAPRPRREAPPEVEEEGGQRTEDG